MRVCGIEIRGTEAILAVVESKTQSIAHLPLETKKITFEDDDDSDHVKSFFSLIKDFVRDNQIDRIAIKKRGRKGEYAGGQQVSRLRGSSSYWIAVTLLSCRRKQSVRLIRSMALIYQTR